MDLRREVAVRKEVGDMSNKIDNKKDISEIKAEKPEAVEGDAALEDAAEGTQVVEITKSALEKILSNSALKLGKNIRVLKALEIQPGAVIAKAHDR
jgi:hypothetical protein